MNEGETYAYVAVGPHTVMATKIARPRGYQAKAGDPTVF